MSTAGRVEGLDRIQSPDRQTCPRRIKKGVGAMKVLQIIGAILIAAGLYVLVKGASYPSDKSLFKVGDVEAKIEQHHEVPPWVGGVGIAAGVVLVVIGIGKRSA